MKKVMFNEFFEMVKEGDNIMTKVDWNDKAREVSFVDGRIHINDHSFDWDEFFSCNTPLMIVNNE